MSKIAKTIGVDTGVLQSKIRHIITNMGAMSLELESITCNTYKLDQKNEDVLDEILYNYKNVAEIKMNLDELISDFNSDILKMDKDMGRLVDTKMKSK